MRVIITGDRSRDCRGLAEAIVGRPVDRHGPDLVVAEGSRSRRVLGYYLKEKRDAKPGR